MRFRAHHLICIRAFEGKGYSKEFIENMANTLKKIKEENPIIYITHGPDVFCEKCPHNDHGCTKHGNISEFNIRSKDERFLKEIGIPLETKGRAKDIIEKAYGKIGAQEIKKLCKTCSWQSICLLKDHLEKVSL